MNKATKIFESDKFQVILDMAVNAEDMVVDQIDKAIEDAIAADLIEENSELEPDLRELMMKVLT